MVFLADLPVFHHDDKVGLLIGDEDYVRERALLYDTERPVNEDTCNI